MIAEWLDVSKLIYITVGLSKRSCQTCVIKHFNSMPLNKASVSRLLSEKGRSICGILTERGVLTRVLYAGRDSKATQLRDVMTECTQRNLVYCISV